MFTAPAVPAAPTHGGVVREFFFNRVSCNQKSYDSDKQNIQENKTDRDLFSYNY